MKSGLCCSLLLLWALASCGGNARTSPGFSDDMLAGLDGRATDSRSDALVQDSLLDRKGLSDGVDTGATDVVRDHSSAFDATETALADLLPDGGRPDTSGDQTCQPSCPEFTCGGDGCGGSCRCPAGYACTTLEPFTCVAQCDLLCAGRLCGKAGELQECDCGTCEDDDNPCTEAFCQPDTGCVQQWTDGACTDNNPCTVGDWCRGGVCEPGSDAKDCDDGEPCTDDSCDPLLETGCVHTNNTQPCEDGNPCTLGDRCLAGVCVGGLFDKDCDDGNPCTDDLCDPKKVGGCDHVPNSSPCQDADPCTLGEVCKEGVCKGTSTLVCNDKNTCTADSCTPGQGCTFTPMEGACDDGNSCTKNDVCTNGACVPGPNSCQCQIDAECDKYNDQDYCNGIFGCNWKTLVCEIKASTITKCPVPPVPVCTEYTCDPRDGTCRLVNANEGMPCEDGNVCTTGDVCQAGVCKAGLGALPCDDGNVCTDDSCDPTIPGGCVHANNTRPCEDKNPCTLLDFCYEGNCTPGGTKKVCTDNNVCTSDICDPMVPGGCWFPPAAGACDDNNPCTLGDFCDKGTCQTGPTPRDCNDNNICTTDSCLAGIGCQYAPACRVHPACILSAAPGALTSNQTCTTPRGRYNCGLSCERWSDTIGAACACWDHMNSIRADCYHCWRNRCEKKDGPDEAQFTCKNIAPYPVM